MKWCLSIALILILANPLRADIVYLNQGEVLSGTITRLDSTGLELTLSDGTIRAFGIAEVFQVTNDQGMVLFPLLQSNQETTPPARKNLLIEPDGDHQPIHSTTAEYRRVYRFPLWPVLGGTVLLGYLGFDQLGKSADTYQESVDREEAGWEFNTLRNESLKQRTWGQISLAGAAVCLLVGITPRIEKVPVHQSLRVLPTRDGFTLCLTF